MICIRIRGLTLEVSVGFCALLSLMLYIDQTGLMLPTLEATLVHELGHLVVMWFLGCRPNAIQFRVGAIDLRGGLPASPWEAALISAAGPLCNLIWFQLEFLCYYFLGWDCLLQRSMVMLVMGFFHLLPISGMDGGTVLYGCLAGRLQEGKVQCISRMISYTSLAALLFVGVGIFWLGKQNPSMLLLALYLLFAELVSKKKIKDCNLGRNAVK